MVMRCRPYGADQGHGRSGCEGPGWQHLGVQGRQGPVQCDTPAGRTKYVLLTPECPGAS